MAEKSYYPSLCIWNITNCTQRVVSSWFHRNDTRGTDLDIHSQSVFRRLGFRPLLS